MQDCFRQHTAKSNTSKVLQLNHQPLFCFQHAMSKNQNLGWGRRKRTFPGYAAKLLIFCQKCISMNILIKEQEKGLLIAYCPLWVPLEAESRAGKYWRCPDQSLLGCGHRRLHYNNPGMDWPLHPEKGQKGNGKVVEEKVGQMRDHNKKTPFWLHCHDRP